MMKQLCNVLFLLMAFTLYAGEHTKWEPIKVENDQAAEHEKAQLEQRKKEFQKKIEEKELYEITDPELQKEQAEISADEAVLRNYDLDKQLKTIPKSNAEEREVLYQQKDANDSLIQATQKRIDQLDQQIARGWKPATDERQKNSQAFLQAVDQNVSFPVRWYNRLKDFIKVSKLEATLKLPDFILNDNNKRLKLYESLDTMYKKLGEDKKRSENAFKWKEALDNTMDALRVDLVKLDIYSKQLEKINKEIADLEKQKLKNAPRYGEAQQEKLTMQREAVVTLLSVTLGDLQLERENLQD